MKKILLFLLLAGISVSVRAQVQFLDSSFHYTGLQDSITADSGLAHAGLLHLVRLQPDGKILTALRSQANLKIELMRFHEDGSRDVSFGNGGLFSALPAGVNLAGIMDMVLQPDGKILLLYYAAQNGSIGVYRLDTNGVTDISFGIAGSVLMPFPTGYRNPNVCQLLLRPDGRIIICGGGVDFVNMQSIERHILWQYSAAGIPDSTFGSNGISIQGPTGLTANAYCALLQPDGKIVIGGETNAPMRLEGGPPTVYRYTSTGFPDSTFGTNGYYIDRSPSSWMPPYITNLALQSQGRIIAGFSDYTSLELRLKRIHSNGTLDTTFGNRGTYTRIPGSWFANYTEFTKIVVLGGDSLLVGCNAVPETSSLDFTLLRVTPNGATDSSWGNNGLVYADFHTDFDHFNDLALQPDGKIVACGGSRNTDGTGYGYPSIARFKVVPRTAPNGLFTPGNFAGKLKLYPNPTTGTVRMEGALAGDKVTVWNAMGQVVLTQKISTPVLEVSALPAGLYQVLVQRNGAVVGSGKLVKE